MAGLDYTNILSNKVQKIAPSGIRKFFDLASEMEDVISLGVGEPDFKTPWSIRKKGIESLEKGRTWYTSNSGLIKLRKEAAKYMEKKIGVSYNPESQTLITVGGSEGIDACIRTLVNPGDEVLIVEPSFVCYGPIVSLTGGIPVPIVTKKENKFRLMPEELKAAITDKTKLLILPFPCNPTGAVMRRHNLEAIAKVLRNTNIMVLSDELYSELTYGKEHVSITQIDGMEERTILIDGFSKAFAMTGWRIGFAMGPEPIIKEMTKIHQYAIMCAPTTAQYAAIEALRNCAENVAYMREEYNTRRSFLVDALNKIGLDCFEPEGAFYAFPDIRSTGLSSEAFCEQLLYAQKVAVVPGNAFGQSGEGFVRISYSYSLEHLIEAVERIELFLKSLK